jgi:hypothetical protein
MRQNRLIMTATHKEPCLTGAGLKSRLLRGQPPLLASFLAGAFLLIALDGLGSTFSLPAQTSATNTLDLGLFSGGTVLTLQMSGQVDLGDTWNTWADGSLVSPVAAGEYSYVNAGATNYPVASGGDSTNHFVGGGANYDVVSGSYGVTGAETTDTTSPFTIRFGAVVGTFSSAPGRDDWFYVGVSNSVTVPTGGAHLYLAVNDAFHPNNTGSYSGVLTGQQQASISLSISGPTGGMIALTWGTVPGWKYQVQYSTNAASTNWSHLGSVLTATNSSLSVSDAIAPAPQRLYRVGGSP